MKFTKLCTNTSKIFIHIMEGNIMSICLFSISYHHFSCYGISKHESWFKCFTTSSLNLNTLLNQINIPNNPIFQASPILINFYWRCTFIPFSHTSIEVNAPSLRRLLCLPVKGLVLFSLFPLPTPHLPITPNYLTHNSTLDF